MVVRRRRRRRRWHDVQEVRQTPGRFYRAVSRYPELITSCGTSIIRMIICSCHATRCCVRIVVLVFLVVVDVDGDGGGGGGGGSADMTSQSSSRTTTCRDGDDGFAVLLLHPQTSVHPSSRRRADDDDDGNGGGGRRLDDETLVRGGRTIVIP